MAETFNGFIINARTKHLIYMMEDIRVALMQRLCNKRQSMEKSSGKICPRIQAMLDKEKDKAANCDVMPSIEHIFNVRYYLDQLIVDLHSRTCTCRKWDLLGVPCCHAVACLFFLHKDAEDYVDEAYRREAYLTAYGGSIPPCEGERFWPRVECDLDPPKIKVGPGRPRKNRIRDPYEDPKKPGVLTRHGMQMTCTNCNEKGHNKRGCPRKDSAVQQQPPTKKPRGRPKKQAASTEPVAQSQPSANHHSTTAQPTQLGRGGRMILGGVGARGGSNARGRGRNGHAGGRGRSEKLVAEGIQEAGAEEEIRYQLVLGFT
ncbi:uncharacterized protein LOC130590266 [Beta vulgaris subsp. vulgaris]|uniref:uncharacterized protein LOC130590266 n=1 Tax=Beta vulgaris subsp. vulgaris TaxID=3555 RepID=UPI0025488E47|nr:uncharacterized protein LOC130590266 [Beta vulgaris subsp. vulgaris]